MACFLSFFRYKYKLEIISDAFLAPRLALNGAGIFSNEKYHFHTLVKCQPQSGTVWTQQSTTDWSRHKNRAQDKELAIIRIKK